MILQKSNFYLCTLMMKTAHTTLIFTVFFFFLQTKLPAQTRNTQPAKENQNVVRVYFDALVSNNGIYYYKGVPFTGLSVSKFPSNKKKQELNWVRGVLHGEKLEWFENGTLKTKMNFVNGQREGAFTLWWSNGNIYMRGTYVNNDYEGRVECFYKSGNIQYVYHYSKGVLHGIATNYFSNGEKENEVNVVNGKSDGVFRAWYPAGNTRKELHFKMGVLHGRSLLWHLNGQMAEESYYKNGVLDSILIAWDAILGTIIKKEHYLNGQKNGVFITYDQFGDTATAMSYKKDKLHGRYVVYQDKKIEAEGNYVNGEKHGFWRTGLVSNYQHQEGNYKNGKRIGTWVYYDLNGKKLMIQEYDNNGVFKKEKQF